MMDRRTFLSTAPLAVVPFAAVAAPGADIPALVEATMDEVIPVGTFVAVRADAMKALCEATGVEFGTHWAMRGKTFA